MEEHKGWIRYTQDPKELLTLEDYYSQYIPKIHEQDDHNFVDQVEPMIKQLPEVIAGTAEKAKKHLSNDFFIEVVIKADRRFEGMYKNIVVARPTCPSPDYERIAYQYHQLTGDIELLLAIPTISRCLQYQNQDYLSIKSDDRVLADYSFRYLTGELDKLEREKNSILKPKKNVFITDL